MSFELNRGQAGRSVRFLARGQGYGLALTKHGPVLALARARNEAAKILALDLVGARPVAPVASDRLPGTVNYLLGRNRSGWRTKIPTYAAVSYRQVWPGIDVLYHGQQGQLEYDFHVAPHADPRAIGLHFSGSTGLSLDRHGSLAVHLGAGTLHELRPHAYQVVAGRRRPVASGYRLLPGGRATVRVGAYDRSRPLVIDPSLTYATYLGGSHTSDPFGNGDEYGLGITADSAGNAYVTGWTASTNFPTQSPYQSALANGSLQDAFVTKLNASGTALVYSTYLGAATANTDPCNCGGGDTKGAGIAVDSSGEAFVTGSTDAASFPTTDGAFQGTLTQNGADGVFVSELSSSGSSLLYSTLLHGSNSRQMQASGIALDSSGHPYVTGYTLDDSFPTTASAVQPTFPTGTSTVPWQAFVTKLDPSASGSDQLVYSSYLGGADHVQGGSTGTQATGIAVNQSTGTAYVTGYTESDQFITKNAYQSALASQNGSSYTDAFVSEIDPSKSGDASLVYSTYFGGAGPEFATGIAVDPTTGNAYITGTSGSGSDFPLANAYQSTPHGVDRGFVAEIGSSGSNLVYSTWLTGTDPQSVTRPRAIALDSASDIFVAGYTAGGDWPTGDGFPLVKPARSTPGYSGNAAFLSEFKPDGSALLFSTYIAADDYGTEDAWGVAAAGGSAYVTGTSTSASGLATGGAFQTTGDDSNGDAFVAKFDVTQGPDVLTSAPSNLTKTAVVMHGTVNPDGQAVTDCHFEYKAHSSSTWGSTQACDQSLTDIGSGSTAVPVTGTISSGLLPSTTYDYRLVAANADGQSTSPPFVQDNSTPWSFQTLDDPAVTTAAATDIASTSATLHGTINPNGAAVQTCTFQYKTDAEAGFSAQAACDQSAQQIGFGRNPVAVSASIPPGTLQPGTSYAFRLNVTTDVGHGITDPPLTFATLGTASTSIDTPADGATYDLNDVIKVAWSCSGTYASCAARDSVGEIGNHQSLGTGTSGTFGFTVVAKDAQGNVLSTLTHHYTVRPAPSVLIANPADGALFNQNDQVPVDWGCSGTFTSCVANDRAGEIGHHQLLSTSEIGTFGMTVKAIGEQGQVLASATHKYTVHAIPPPPPSTSGGLHTLSVGDESPALVAAYQEYQQELLAAAPTCTKQSSADIGQLLSCINNATLAASIKYQTAVTTIRAAEAAASVAFAWPKTAVLGLTDANGPLASEDAAHNVIAVGGGNVIAVGGGNVIAVGGGNVITVGGGNVTGGSNVIAVGGGNIITVGAGNVIAVGGGNFIAVGAGHIVVDYGDRLVDLDPSSGSLVTDKATGNLMGCTQCRLLNPDGSLYKDAGSDVIAVGGGNLLSLSQGLMNSLSTNSVQLTAGVENIKLQAPVGSDGVIAVGGGNVIAVGGGNVIAVGGGHRALGTSAVARAARARKPKPLTLASGAATFKKPGLQTLTAAFSGKARRILRTLAKANAKRLKAHQKPLGIPITVVETWTPTGGKPIVTKHTIRVSPASKKH